MVRRVRKGQTVDLDCMDTLTRMGQENDDRPAAACRGFAESAVLRQFRGLRKALVDTSSIIYMQKAGFFREVAHAVELYAPPEIVAETGFADLPVRGRHLSFRRGLQ